MEKTIKDLLHFNIFYNYKDYPRPSEWEKSLLIPLNEFMCNLKHRIYTNYDGCGKLVYRNRVLSDSKLFLMQSDSDNAHISFNGYNIRLRVLDLIFSNDVRIVWFNK